MAAVSPAQPEPRITVSRISVIRFPVSILDASPQNAVILSDPKRSDGESKNLRLFLLASCSTVLGPLHYDEVHGQSDSYLRTAAAPRRRGHRNSRRHAQAGHGP